MTQPEDEQKPIPFPTFVLPDETRRALLEAISRAVAQGGQAAQAMSAASAAVERFTAATAPLQAAAAQLAANLAPLREMIGQLPVLTAAAKPGAATVREFVDTAGLADAVTVTVTTVATRSSVGDVNVVTSDGGAEADTLGEDTYQLLSLMLLRLDELAEPRPRTASEYYGLVTNTLSLLVTLLAWLKPMS